MQTDTIKAIINSFNAASDDMTRYNLTFVLMHSGGNGWVKIVATDGAILSNVSIHDPNLSSELKSHRYLISPDTIPMLKTLLKEFKTAGGVPCEVTSDNVTLKTDTFHVEFKSEQALNISFPDISRLKPEYSEDAFQIKINPELLHQLFKAMNQEKKDAGLTLTFKDSKTPVLARIGESEGLIMPMQK